MQKKQAERNLQILEFLKDNPGVSSKEVYGRVVKTSGYATVKRILQDLIKQQLVRATGQGKGTKYQLSREYGVLHPVNVDEYFEKEIDERVIREGYNHILITETLPKIAFFTLDELNLLNSLQRKYTENISHLTPFQFNKEMERLAIDLSWKSSQIEGNTYSLLETERLLKEKETAAGKTQDEATMLLNHKTAIDFIIEHADYVKPLTPSNIEDIHSILINGLHIERNIRNRRVGVSGTNYKPLDNAFQIKEAIDDMCALVNCQETVFAKALLVLVLISYIQPFEDGNKRTGRIVSNAVLMNNKFCPISFRTVSSIEYKKAMLIFYEQNNIAAFKKIFIEQFEFAVETYF
jgi:Fic family protein